MSWRAKDIAGIPVLSKFSEIGVCEAMLANGAARITLGRLALPAPPASPGKLALPGDTDWHLKGRNIQNCNRQVLGTEWNFASIAAATANEAPDLVLHIGDMHYREYVSVCGTGDAQSNPGCNGFDPDTVGYSWVSWKADIFDPARPMLAAAPFVPVRGNHEECSDRASRD